MGAEDLLMIGGMFTLMGALFVVIGLITKKVLTCRQKKASASTIATVVEIVMRNSDNGANCYPIFEFYANGETHQVCSHIAISPCPFREGERVELCYDPDNPSKIYVEKQARSMGNVTIFFRLFGGLFAVIGLAVFFAGFLSSNR